MESSVSTTQLRHKKCMTCNPFNIFQYISPHQHGPHCLSTPPRHLHLKLNSHHKLIFNLSQSNATQRNGPSGLLGPGVKSESARCAYMCNDTIAVHAASAVQFVKLPMHTPGGYSKECLFLRPLASDFLALSL